MESIPSRVPSVKPNRPLQPVPAPVWRWLRRPVWPCVLLPSGYLGLLEINGEVYGVLPLGEYPSRGWRILKASGDTYDVDTACSWGWQCDCPDATYRPNRPRGCKHVRALRDAIEALFTDKWEGQP